MSLAAEDKDMLRTLAHEARTNQQRTNDLLEEIRDFLKSPPVTVSGRPYPGEIAKDEAGRPRTT